MKPRSHYQFRELRGSIPAPPGAWAHNLWKTVGRQHGTAGVPAGVATKVIEGSPGD